jgi:hypothetical protein
MQAAVLHAVTILPWGCRMKYPCDVSDHQFHRKWAILLDRNCEKNDIRGFLKCDIAVIRKGERAKVYSSDENKDEDDIEG